MCTNIFSDEYSAYIELLDLVTMTAHGTADLETYEAETVVVCFCTQEDGCSAAVSAGQMDNARVYRRIGRKHRNLELARGGALLARVDPIEKTTAGGGEAAMTMSVAERKETGYAASPVAPCVACLTRPSPLALGVGT